MTENPTFWLNVTNTVVGLATLIAILAVAGGFGYELVWRLFHRRAAAADHRLVPVQGLGLTMADGGEPLSQPSSKSAGADGSEPCAAPSSKK